MTLKDLKNKKFLVMGLGLNEGGVGVVKFLVKNGAKVLVTDLKTKQELKESLEKLKGLKVQYVLGRHRFNDFLWADWVIKNPAVRADSPYLKFCQKHRIPILSDLGLFFQLVKFPLRLIAISGTKGKSTTSYLIYQLLKNAGKEVYLAGNLGISVFDVYNHLNRRSWLVLELSAQQLEDLAKVYFRPKIAVLTNIFEDHLDRYPNLRAYRNVKKLIFKDQKPTDFLVLNGGDTNTLKLGRFARSQVFFFNLKEKNAQNKNGVFIKNHWLYFKNKSKIKKIIPVNLIEDHPYFLNFLAAITSSLLLKIPKNVILKTLKNFKGLPYRLELVKKIKGVSYYNDATATNPLATLFALLKIKSPTILILGGRNKKLNFKPLTDYLIKDNRVKKIILLTHRFYDASLILEKQLKKISFKIEKATSLEKALKIASQFAQKGDSVLFSPAAASFFMFKNEFERGRLFSQLVQGLDRAKKFSNHLIREK